jgi:hypothetical protein
MNTSHPTALRCCLLTVLGLAALSLGCLPSTPEAYVVKDVARLRDPARASLRNRDGTILPEGNTPASVTYWLPVPRGSRASWTFNVVREKSGALAFDHGERDHIVSAGGQVMEFDRAEPVADILRRSEAVMEVCVTRTIFRLTHTSTSYGPCTPGSQFRAQIVTPWDNVIEIREVKRYPGRPDTIAGMCGVLGGIFLGVPGVTFVALGAAEPRGSSEQVGFLVGGSVALALSIGACASVAPLMFARDKSEVLFPLPAP